MAQTVKNLPAMQETQVRTLGQKDPLEKVMATQFALRIPWTKESGRLQSMGLDIIEQLTLHFSLTSTHRMPAAHSQL